jgi:hypothetical protein
VLADVDISWVNRKVVQSHIGMNVHSATRSRTSSQNIQKGRLEAVAVEEVSYLVVLARFAAVVVRFGK